VHTCPRFGVSLWQIVGPAFLFCATLSVFSSWSLLAKLGIFNTFSPFASLNPCVNVNPCVVPGSIRFLSKSSLLVQNVGRRDRGVYQCLVENQRASAQAMAELKLGGELTSTCIVYEAEFWHLSRALPGNRFFFSLLCRHCAGIDLHLHWAERASRAINIA